MGRFAAMSLAALVALGMGTATAQDARQTTPGRYAFNVVKKGASYASVRGDLLSAGNVPDYHPTRACSDFDAICRVYPETEDCSGTGLNYCRFGWTAKEGGHYFVVTIGEAVGSISVGAVMKE